jgi:hypothetical protein
MSYYKDVIGNRRRTWPYGTQKQVTVIHVDRRFIICADEEDKAGYVLLGTNSEGAKENDKGIITFTEGGPMGGYWKFKKTIV